jgi:fermentation-respiration switch protein FrsA (DUF1100 family)
MEKEQSFKFSYESLWKFIIRPPRGNYKESDLGPKVFNRRNNKIYTRTDYTILSKRGFLLKCSFFQQELFSRKPFIMPVIIYLHGNSSSRMEGKKLVEFLFDYDINTFIFDFAGCGLSEGSYISLGYHEKNDLETIINFVEKLPGVGNIGLWGRSMGAATILLYTHSDSRIKAICVDSSFADFSVLAQNLVYSYMKIPGFIVKGALIFIRKTILNQNDFDIDELKPILFCSKSFVPAFFIHALADELIPLDHTLQLYEAYAGEKSINIVEGGHNSSRQLHIIRTVVKFFTQYLNDESKI